jgi:hypothetical protein
MAIGNENSVELSSRLCFYLGSSGHADNQSSVYAARVLRLPEHPHLHLKSPRTMYRPLLAWSQIVPPLWNR